MDDLKKMTAEELLAAHRHAAKNWLTDECYQEIRGELLHRLSEADPPEKEPVPELAAKSGGAQKLSIAGEIAFEASKLARLSASGEKIAHFAKVIEGILERRLAQPQAQEFCGAKPPWGNKDDACTWEKGHPENYHEGSGQPRLPKQLSLPLPRCPKCGSDWIDVHFNAYVNDKQRESTATCRKSTCVHSGPATEFFRPSPPASETGGGK